ncbi:MAG TPA: argininosuccinate lyase [Gemmatimonadaceae bacterium]|nr:argininosuccinate lyase [Gemmatimonadaceae bacterium]
MTTSLLPVQPNDGPLAEEAARRSSGGTRRSAPRPALDDVRLRAEAGVIPQEPAQPASVGTSPGAPHRLWGGRFGGGGPAPALERLNRSVDVDFRLWPHDVRLSKAWAVALSLAGVLTADEARRMEAALDAVGERLASGEGPTAADEDVHTVIDRLLHQEAGAELAAKLHTGRSRNDQVATATRLWAAGAARDLAEAVRALQAAVADQAEALGAAVMPAYTHLQQAQPVLAAHWMLAHFWALERDRGRMAAARRGALAALPLGSGAIAGSAYPIDRVLLKESLGFAAPSPNSIDAVGDRDFVAELLFAVTLLCTHLSRLAEDLIVFGSSEFGFVRFGDRFTTGSSMMPQKRNPDVLELARGSGARVLGDLMALLATLKGLPSGYSKDLQDDKRALFGAVDMTTLVLPAVTGALAELRFDTRRMREAIVGATLATDLADYLVRKGATFRESHEAVGRLVRESEQSGCDLHALPYASLTAAHPLFDRDAFDCLSPRHSIERRAVDGGTAPDAVSAQLETARRALESKD